MTKVPHKGHTAYVTIQVVSKVTNQIHCQKSYELNC